MLRPFVWTVPTRVVQAADSGGEAARALVGRTRCLVLADPAIGAYARSLADSIGAERLAVPARCDFAAVRELSDTVREQAPQSVVLIGGGSVLDLGRVAALAVARPDVGTLDGWSGQGLRRATHPPAEPNALRVIAIPTTFGTGAEVSSLAVIADPTRPLRVVVADAGLPARAAVLDVAVLRSLPHQQIRDGLLEIAARLLGPALADDGTHPLADDLAMALLRRVIALSAQVRAIPVGSPVPDELLATAAWASTLTATQLASVGRSVSDSPLWLLQHAITGSRPEVTKASALRAVLPMLLTRVAGGHHAAPIVIAGSCARICAGLTGTAADSSAGAAARLLQVLTDSGLMEGPTAPIDPAVGALLVSEGFTRTGGLLGCDAASLAHLLSPATDEPDAGADQPFAPNGSR